VAAPWDAPRLPPAIAGLAAYDPGLDLVAFRRRFPDGLAELGSNENAWGPSPAALDAAAAALRNACRYPDPLGGELKQALARQHRIDAGQIALGNGSHELLMLLAQAFVPAGTGVVHSQYGFAVFGLAAAAAGARTTVTPALPADHPMPLGHDPEALARACGGDTRVLFLANPNNPTGTWLEPDRLAALLARVPGSTLVVVDEAYQEYQPDSEAGSAVRLLPRHRNLVVTRTFSKAHGLAGLRMGYALAAAPVIAVLERLRQSFNGNAVALAAAQAALADPGHVERVVAATTAERGRIAAGLAALGLTAGPSRGNFLLVDFGAPARAAAVLAHLCERAVVVRPMGGYGLAGHLRISVGRPAENDRLLAALADAP
jgi:histidinol-phosphate aminotransferase